MSIATIPAFPDLLSGVTWTFTQPWLGYYYPAGQYPIIQWNTAVFSTEFASSDCLNVGGRNGSRLAL